MLHFRGTVEYKDGRKEEWEAGSAVVAEWEFYAMRHGFPLDPEKSPRMVWALVVTHAALGVDEGFDTWRRTVSAVDVQPDDEAVPPTLPEPSTGSRSSSPSPSDGVLTT